MSNQFNYQSYILPNQSIDSKLFGTKDRFIISWYLEDDIFSDDNMGLEKMESMLAHLYYTGAQADQLENFNTFYIFSQIAINDLLIITDHLQKLYFCRVVDVIRLGSRKISLKVEPFPFDGDFRFKNFNINEKSRKLNPLEIPQTLISQFTEYRKKYLLACRDNFEITKSIGKNDEDLTEMHNEQTRGIKLFFGTTRCLAKDKIIPKFENDLSDLTTGLCQIEIPAGHTQGRIERAKSFLKLSFHNNNCHFYMSQISVLNTSEFKANFEKLSKNCINKDLLIFIHGFNTTFSDAAYRTAQLSLDMPFKGLTAFFSWPSAGKMSHYLADEVKAKGSIVGLKKYIESFLESKDIHKIHFIAHSMGNHVLIGALNQISRDPLNSSNLIKMGQIILGAPDVDQLEFKDLMLPDLKRIGQRRTLYCSEKDNPLGLSSWFRKFNPRLGQAGEHIFKHSSLDTIDTTNVKGATSHSYIFDNNQLLNDIYYLLHLGLEPEQRRLNMLKDKNKTYFAFQ